MVGEWWIDGEFSVFESAYYSWCVSWEEPGVSPRWWRILPKTWAVLNCG